MWLIDVETYQLHNFIGTDIVPYAILSHTWGDDEVSFHDVTTNLNMARGKAGFVKIEYSCQQAKRDGLRYAWVDTCCIDKSSSAELQEAINSMFQWYAGAAVCYAYLGDVDVDAYRSSPDTLSDAPGTSDVILLMRNSRWLTRGWTLQELIAPDHLLFFDKAWRQIGSRFDLAEQLAELTKIDCQVLKHKYYYMKDYRVSRDQATAIRSYSVAQRMSWAANRDTTRIEDRAYSLLGIFGVSMPLLYGEGENAFVRLQEEILRRDNDISILAWERPMYAALADLSLLAKSPDDFANAGAIVQTKRERSAGGFRTVEVFSTGLRVNLRLMQMPAQGAPSGLAAGLLDCRFADDITTVLALQLLPGEPVRDTHAAGASADPQPRVAFYVPSWGRKPPNRLVPIDVLEARKVAELTTVTIARLPKPYHYYADAFDIYTPRATKYLWIRADRTLWQLFDAFPSHAWNWKTCTLDLNSLPAELEAAHGAAAFRSSPSLGALIFSFHAHRKRHGFADLSWHVESDSPIIPVTERLQHAMSHDIVNVGVEKTVQLAIGITAIVVKGREEIIDGCKVAVLTVEAGTM